MLEKRELRESYHRVPKNISKKLLIPFCTQVIFFCLTEPNEKLGGITPLVRNSEVFAQLDSAIVKKLEEKQIRYTRYLPDEKHKPYASWQQSFMTRDPKVWQHVLDEWVRRTSCLRSRDCPPFSLSTYSLYSPSCLRLLRRLNANHLKGCRLSPKYLSNSCFVRILH